MITLNGVSFRHPGAETGEAVAGVSLSIRDGEWVAIAGANGSGKTTLCKLIAGLARPLAGAVEVDGRPAAEVLRSARGESAISIAFQDPDSQFVTTSVRAEILFGLENLGLDEAAAASRCDEALEAFGLGKLAARNPHTLSGGEKQRLVLAAISAMRPRCLVLDEPLSYLDDWGRRLFLQQLRAGFMERGRTIVWATVSRDEVDLADRVLFVEKGRVIFDGRPAELEAALPADTLDNALLRSRPPEHNLLLRPRDTDAGPIHVEEACFSLEGKQCDMHVTRFDLPEGKTVGIFGPSGSGKTTFLLGCAGLLPPLRGSVSLFGKPVRKRRDFPAGRVAYLFQSPEQGFFAPTVREEVGLGYRSFRGEAGEPEAARKALERAGLAPERFLERSPFHLSEGEKRLVALAGVLILEAPVLILDEPTISLDGRARRVLVDVLGKLGREGTSMLIASHDMGLLDAIAGSVYTIVGRLLF